MAINLVKGQKVNLRKENTKENIKRVMVGLGWDEVVQEEKEPEKKDIDCDALAILCKNGKLQEFNKDVVFYNNLRHASGAIAHQGDNLFGGDGVADDEQIFVDLSGLEDEYDRIIFAVTIYDAKARNHHFGLFTNAFIRVCDTVSGNEICRYNLAEDYSGKTALIVGEFINENGEWKFVAIGQGTEDDGVLEVAKRFK